MNEIEVYGMNSADWLLFEAVTDGNVEKVRGALENGADIHARDAYGRRPIDYCDDNAHDRWFNPSIRTMLLGREMAAALDAHLPAAAPTPTRARL